ncbi:hypothetical protein [Haloarchaeobius salinus]|uniref:hypothetical protein n=1 Tax=Haloarchaeobius salinus TaxID=1198298 RepID=UPI00210F180A|nr:hypothetical protein [Haloarchaeobius salinus]
MRLPTVLLALGAVAAVVLTLDGGGGSSGASDDSTRTNDSEPTGSFDASAVRDLLQLDREDAAGDGFRPGTRGSLVGGQVDDGYETGDGGVGL